MATTAIQSQGIDSGALWFHGFNMRSQASSSERQRVHPVCPVIAHGGLYVFIGNHSPKVQDLRRDGCFALHAFSHPEVDDEFYVSGRARRVDDAVVRQVVYEAYTATGACTSNDTLFELWLERALHAKYGPRPSWPPVYTKWSSVVEKP